VAERVKLTEREIEALTGAAEDRCIRGNDKGQAISREAYGTAVAMAMQKPPLTKIVPRKDGGPRVDITDAGCSALASQENAHDRG
jgi:hypothetical protein